jgi:AhpD family alkylhydroperoxidase
MAHIPTLPPEKASAEAKAVYDEFHRRMSFPAAPNFITTLGHAPAIARATWEAVRNILVTGEIPRWKKELVFVAISKDRNCKYCFAAHAACCRMLGVQPAMLEQMVQDVSLIPDGALRDMITFARKCAKDPQSVDSAVYANIIADATAMEADAMFAQILA